MSSSSSLFAVPVHSANQQVMERVAELLSSQWGKSKCAREAMLGRSNDATPIHLAFVLAGSAPFAMAATNSSVEVEVIGHSVIHRVDDHVGAAMVESVVVIEGGRGKGYGRAVMELTEDLARRAGFSRMYLSTKDKQGFYAHLGYQECQPVSSLRGFGSESRLGTAQMQSLLSAFGGGNSAAAATHPSDVLPVSAIAATNQDAPAPPPPPQVSLSATGTEVVTWMCKDLSSCS